MTIRLVPSQALLPAALLAAALAGCQDEAVDQPTSMSDTLRQGAGVGGLGAQVDAGRPTSDELALQDPHEGGQGVSFELASVAFGRLVELWGKNADGTDVRVAREFVVGADYAGDGVRSHLVSQPTIGVDRLMIREVVDGAPAARRRFLALAQAAADSAVSLSDAGPSGAGTLSAVPRNAALVLRFNDLIDPASIGALGAMLRVGDPAIVPFQPRLAAHDLFGGADAATGAHRSTRIVVDFTVTGVEALRSSAGLATNSIGLPPATEADVPHAELRLPTLALAGLARPLQSTGGTPLGVSPGSIDYGSATQDIVRPFSVAPSSGAYRGFLPDNDPPRLVAEAEVDLPAAPLQLPSAVDLFILPRIQFASPGCAGPAQVGDIISQPGVLAEIVLDSGPASGSGLDSVQVRLLDFPSSWTGPEQWEIEGQGVAFYQAPYDTLMDDGRVACLVGVTPAPLGSPSAPTRGVSPDAVFQLRYNEPLGDAGANQMESVLISRVAVGASADFNPRDVVVAVGTSVGASTFSGGFTVRPEVPLAHAAGDSEVYYLTPRLGDHAVEDLAGNALAESPGPIAMSMDPAARPVSTGGVLLGFERGRELGNIGFDFSGQLRTAFDASLIRPRPVVRFQGNVDHSIPVIAAQSHFLAGVQTPLNPLGARMQTLWRYCDMGFGLTDPNTANIEVERLYWSPAGGTVDPDSFEEFEIKLSHSRWTPDEVLNPTSLFPQFQNSGMRAIFDSNGLPGEDQQVVHPRHLGYTFSAGDIVQAPSGTSLVPFPMNRVAHEPLRTFTWRDTSLRMRGGLASGGVEPQAALLASGTPFPSEAYYRAGQVRTGGLPLLLDFATFPDNLANGQNGWSINLAANSSSRPYFRAFSAGGVDASGNTVLVDPDQEVSANGGFIQGSSPPGLATYGRDNAVFLGAADFVVRVSLGHSVWIEAGPATSLRRFTQPLASTPAGQAFSVTVDVRGASDIMNIPGTDRLANDGNGNGIPDMLEDAHLLDLYGDFYNDAGPHDPSHSSFNENPGVTFLSNSTTLAPTDWRALTSTIEGARYVQLRLRMESDIVTGEAPDVRAIGIAWTE